jgi:hypothetical protein
MRRASLSGGQAHKVAYPGLTRRVAIADFQASACGNSFFPGFRPEEIPYAPGLAR